MGTLDDERGTWDGKVVATVWLFRSTAETRENENFCILRCAVEFMTILLVQTGLAGTSGLNNEVSLIVL